MSTIDTRINYQGHSFSYSGGYATGGYHIMQHRSNIMHRELVNAIEPLVECGFDANQIKQELDYISSDRLVTLEQINNAINTILADSDDWTDPVPTCDEAEQVRLNHDLMSV